QLPADASIDALQGDSGAFATDFISNSATVALSGTFSMALQSGETAYISVDGGASWEEITQISGTDWTYTDPVARPDGVYYYEVYVADGAGNVGGSDTRKVVVDTTDPGVISIDAITTDTGASATDFYTADTVLTLSGSLSA